MAFGTSGGFGASKPTLTNQNSYSQAGERVSDPKRILAIALAQKASTDASETVSAGPLAKMITGLKKKKKGK